MFFESVHSLLSNLGLKVELFKFLVYVFRGKLKYKFHICSFLLPIFICKKNISFMKWLKNISILYKNLLLQKLTCIFTCDNVWLCWISCNLFLKYVLICYIIVMHLHITVLLSVTKSAEFNCKTVQHQSTVLKE